MAETLRRRRTKKSSIEKPAPGVIDPQRLYSLEGLARCAGITPAGIRAARKDGLRVRYALGRGWCLGEDFLAYVRECGKETYHGTTTGGDEPA